MWFTPRMGLTSTKLCFYYISWGKLAQSVALHMQREISSRSLVYFYLYIAFLSIDPSLSFLSVDGYIQTQMTHRQARCLDRYNTVCLTDSWVYSKILYWPTNDSSYEPTNWLTDWLANPLQYKMQAFIGGPKVSPLQNCGPVPTVNPYPN